MVSVIIPHYNSPGLLEKLIKSIPEDGFEIIVVDDKSDKELEKLKVVQEKYRDRCSFLENTTGKKGAGVCRNIALSKASGDYILFADADDFFTKDLDMKIRPYMDGRYDMVYFMPDSIQLETGKRANRHLAYKALMEEYLKKKDEASLAQLKYTFITPWSKLVKRRLISDNNIQFDDTIVANDVMAMTKCAFYAKKTAVSRDVIYCVTRMGKTLTTKKDENKFDVREEVFMRRHEFLKKNLPGKQFSAVHLNQIAISHILNAVIYGYGLKKSMKLMCVYIKNGVKLLDLQLINPFAMYKKVKMFIAWRKEDVTI